MVRTAEEYRALYRSISGSLFVAAADGDATLVAAMAGHTIFIQLIVAYVTTDAAQSWSFEDDNGTPRKIAEVSASPGDETRWEFWFGNMGVPLTEAKAFVLNASAAGLAGHIEWYGYRKMTAVMSTAAFAAA